MIRQNSKSVFYIVALIGLLFASCITTKPAEDFSSEPEDPNKPDIAVWRNVEPGIHSGFGTIDKAYLKSTPPEGPVREAIKLQGWKGERVSFKLLVWTATGNEEISIEVRDIESDGLTIDKDQIKVSPVGYVLADQFLNEIGAACGPRDNDKVPVFIAPDILLDNDRFVLNGPVTRPVWVSVDIPADATAGVYHGVITRKSQSGTVSHPFTLEVQDKLLPPPAEWPFHLDLWQNPYAVARYHGVELWSDAHLDLLRPLLKMLADAGQKCITAIIVDKPWDGESIHDPFRSMVHWTKKADGSWEFDYTIFDTYVKLAMECGITKKIDCYSMVPINNRFSWYDEATADTIDMVAKPGTEAYEALWREFLPDFRSHLQKRGWLDITTIALDERAEEEMQQMFRFLEETAPEFKITMAGFYHESVNESIYDFSSNWRDQWRIPAEAIQARRDKGLITTYYVACGIPKPNNFTFSPPAEGAYEGWLAAAMGFDGFLRWAYCSWPEDPMVDSRFNKFPAGDTFFVYPGPLSSIRFERLREGIQDYEKIRILREALAENPSPEAAAAKEKLLNFLHGIDSGTIQRRTAYDVINEGKQLIYDIVNEVF